MRKIFLFTIMSVLATIQICADDAVNYYQISGGETAGTEINSVPNVVFSFGISSDETWSSGSSSVIVNGITYTTYIAGNNNPSPNNGSVPTEGTFYKFKIEKEGNLIIVVQNAGYNKYAYFVDSLGTNGNTYKGLLLNLDNAEWTSGNILDTLSAYSGGISIDVTPGEYWFYLSGSKVRFMGFQFIVSESEDEQGEGSFLSTGTYWIKNVATDLYLSAGGETWGTQAIVNEVGLDFVVDVVTDSTCTISGNVYSSESKKYLGTNLYVDAEIALWKLDLGEDGYYTLYNDTIEEYLTALTDGSGNVIGDSVISNASKWEFVTTEERLAELSKASASVGVDATFMIPGFNFSREDQRNNSWQGTFSLGGANGNYCAERWNVASIDVYQEISNMPAGKYTLTAQGFYRNGGYSEAATLRENNQEALLATLYANNNSVALKSIFEEACTEKVGSADKETSFGYIPDDMAGASARFTLGEYVNTVDFELSEAGIIKLGIIKSDSLAYDWTIFDNFRLTYFGTGSPSIIPTVDGNNIEPDDEGNYIYNDTVEAFSGATLVFNDEKIASVDTSAINIGVPFSLNVNENTIVITTDSVYKEQGESYTIRIAERAIIGVNGNYNPALYLGYLVDTKEEITATIDPAEGVVDSLSSFVITFNKEVIEADGIGETPTVITLTDAEGDTIAVGTASSDWDNSYIGIITLDTTISEAGEYTLNVPTATFYLGEQSDIPNDAMTFSYTIEAGPVYKEITEDYIFLLTQTNIDGAVAEGWMNVDGNATTTSKKGSIDPSTGDSVSAQVFEGHIVKLDGNRWVKAYVTGVKEVVAFAVSSSSSERCLRITATPTESTYSKATVTSDPSTSGNSVKTSLELESSGQYEVLFEGISAEDLSSGSDVVLYGIWFNVSVASGITSVNETSINNYSVYTINGLKVRNAGESLEGLTKGLYIIGGKKFVVK